MTFSIITAVVLVLLVAGYVRSVLLWRVRSRGKPLPPGPNGLPFIGNILKMPKVRPWLGLRDMCKKYGDVLCFKIFNEYVIILGSAATVLEYLDRRSANTSDRKQTQSLLLTGHEWSFGFWPYGAAWRDHRRLFWQHFHPGTIIKYRPVQRATAHNFLVKLLREPESLNEHIEYTFSAALLKLGYGIDAADRNDETLATVQAGVLGTREIIISGGFLVDYFPFLRHWPASFPGGGFRKKFSKWRTSLHRMTDAPFERYQSSAKRDGRPSCIVSDLLASSKEQLPSAQITAKSIAAVVFVAGSDTTLSTLQTFFLAMSLYPEVQKKAQAELDAVVGHDRLPDFEDRDSLVYVSAIIMECLRWFNVAPLGLSHSTIDDDEYEGYFIPAGTNIMANVWACMHDPEVYEEPDAFRPERFIRDGQIDRSVRDSSDFVFGFGRRICPGRYFADAALFINMASVLHVFNITPPLDEDAKEIEVVPRMSDGFVSCPEDCRCTIKPRAPWTETLISSMQHDGTT